MQRLAGKTIIIAGAGTGIGAATAVRCAQEGAAVVVADITLDGCEAVAASIAAAGGTAHPLRFDMRDEESIARMFRFAEETLGGLDGLHCNAADLGAARHDTNVLDIDMEIYDRTMEVNLRGHMLCTRHAIPLLLARGGGALVYTSSLAAYLGEKKRIAYQISKAGVNALTRHVARTWGKQNIRANAVAPGMTLTEANAGSPPDRLARALAGTPSTRLGKPEDIAGMVAMLMSADGSWINGQVIQVDGGAVMRA